MLACVLHPVSDRPSTSKEIQVSHLSTGGRDAGRFRYVLLNSITFLRSFLGNIDENLLKFLKLYFPKEVKAKQNENEKAAGLDLLENTGLGPRQMGERGNCIIA